jgi:hypothetical protein
MVIITNGEIITELHELMKIIFLQHQQSIQKNMNELDTQEIINTEFEIQIFGKKMKNEEVIMMNYGINERKKKFNDHVL